MRNSGTREPAGLPDSLEGRLRTAYLHHLLRNESLVSDIAALEESLEGQGIRRLYFKGPWLMLCAYPDPGTRPVDDIDLGIREPDYRGAVAALRAVGYVPEGPLPETAEEALETVHYRRQLRFHATGRRPVELHFRLVNVGPPAKDERWVWDTAREISIGSRAIAVPGAAAMLLHLALHANQHGFSVLRLLLDIRYALERDGSSIDGELFLSRVDALRCRASAYHALLLAHDLAGAEPSADLLAALKPAAWRRQAFVRAWRVEHARRLEAVPGRMELEAPFLYVLEMGRLRDKVGYLSRVVVRAAAARTFPGSTTRTRQLFRSGGGS